MQFFYKAISNNGDKKNGTIDAINMEVAISSLQKNGLILSDISPTGEKKGLNLEISFFSKVSTKDIVIMSRQLATLFDAQVSALRVFTLIGDQLENITLKRHLLEVSDDLKGGSSISNALAKHPDIFSDFYINMVKAGEESGKLDETFNYLADYLDRNYEVTSKAKNALIYPAFVITIFFAVMIFMFTFIIPQIALMIKDSGQEVPIYTKIVLGISDLLVKNGLFLAVGVVILLFGLWKYVKTRAGSRMMDEIKLEVPYIGNLFRKLYLSRIADNMSTMISSGVPMLRALEITSKVVDNQVYKDVLDYSLAQVKGGVPLSNALSQYPDHVPGIMTQMVKVGEETGRLGSMLKTLAKFYQREVINAVDTLISLIEPVMIVGLGLGVGILLASVLMPIYNIASSA